MILNKRNWNLIQKSILFIIKSVTKTSEKKKTDKSIFIAFQGEMKLLKRLCKFPSSSVKKYEPYRVYHWDK